MNKLERLTILAWSNAGVTLEDIFSHYPSRELIVRRLLISGNDVLDVVADTMPLVDQARIEVVARFISQHRHLAPNLMHRPTGRKESRP